MFTWTRSKVALLYVCISSLTMPFIIRRHRIVARPQPYMYTIAACCCTRTIPSPVTPPTIDCNTYLTNGVIITCLVVNV